MDAIELRQKSTEELNEILADKLQEQFNLRMQKGTEQLSKPDQIKKVRRDIARVHTIIHEIESIQT